MLGAQDDTILRAMKDELKRSMSLKLQNLESPYYIEYQLDDAMQFSTVATLGGLISVNDSHFRAPRVRVRVGNYDFDNTDYVGSNYQFRIALRHPAAPRQQLPGAARKSVAGDRPELQIRPGGNRPQARGFTQPVHR